jgi:hypothetical protein
VAGPTDDPFMTTRDAEDIGRPDVTPSNTTPNGAQAVLAAATGRRRPALLLVLPHVIRFALQP